VHDLTLECDADCLASGHSKPHFISSSDFGAE
jgi:hypothetical protein